MNFHLLLSDGLEALLVTSVQCLLTVCRPLYLTGCDYHLNKDNLYFYKHPKEDLFVADLSGPLSDPFLSLVEVFLEVKATRSKNLLQRLVHHVLNNAQPTLPHWTSIISNACLYYSYAINASTHYFRNLCIMSSTVHSQPCHIGHP